MHVVGSAKKLGAQVRRLREAREWSRFTLAKKADCHPNTILDIERGLGNPTLSILRSIAKALDVTIGDLLGEKVA